MLSIMPLPTGFMTEVTSNMATIFSDLSSYVGLIVGVLLGVVILGAIIGFIKH